MIESSSRRVAICIPVYNGRPYVAETIASVRAQTFTDWELVITENGSSDQSHELIEELLAARPDPRIRYLRYPTATGLPADWNRAIRLARGEFIKLLPCDDLLHPECLARQVEALSRRPELGFVSCSRRIIDALGRTRLPSRPRRDRELVRGDGRRALLSAGHNPIGEPVCGLIRRDLMDSLGGYDESYRYYPDLDFWCRALVQRPGLIQGAHLCDFRVHAGTQSTALRERYVREYQDLIDRHSKTFEVSPFDRRSALLRARVVARARSLFIDWVLKAN